MKVLVTNLASCQPLATMLEVSDEVVYGELTGEPMHEIIGGDLWLDGKNVNAKYIMSKYFAENRNERS